MNKPLLAIVGPTGIGKTKLALEIQKRRGNCQLISVDSRQVYRGMDIGTGKDAKISGTDLVKPEKIFNVADFCRQVTPIVEKTWRENKLPILVGGTGLYLKALIDGIETLAIPPDETLRQKLEKMTVQELQEKIGWRKNMNNSDWQNPRRLIRKIEINEVKNREAPTVKLVHLQPDSLLILGLKTLFEKIKDQIILRVKDRMKLGLLTEIENLTAVYGWNLVLRSTIAYKEWEDFYLQKITKEEAIRRWIRDETAYAKRQLTWFKKDPRVIWLEKTTPDEEKTINEALALLDKTFDML